MEHLLTESFFKAAGQWSEDSGDPHGIDIAFFVMTATGGGHSVPRVGKRDLTGLTKEEVGDLTVGEVYGYHTLDQSYQWIIRLVDQQGFFEPFLITALVRWVEEWLERALEEYAKGIGRLRRVAESAREKLEATPDDARLLATVQYMERLATPSLHEMRKRRERLARWRQLTAAVTSEENIKAWYNGLAASLAEPPEEPAGQS